MEDEEADPDKARLSQLGYKQELKRHLTFIINFEFSFSFFSFLFLCFFFIFISVVFCVSDWFELRMLENFAFSFSIISVMTGITTTYNTGLRYGGPVSATLGWLLVSLLNGCVAFCMAEICSAYPTAGGLYYWSAKLAGRRWAPLASWITGWFNIVGQTEETKNADINGPKGIINSVAISSIVGYIYLISITFTVRDIPYLLRSDNDAGGYAIAEVFFLVFKNRYGSGVGGIICLGFVAIAVFFCGLSAVASNSRMTYAFARDGALPFSSFWCRVNKEEVPANAVWLALAVSFCMALTSLGSLVAFQAMVSIATIGLYIAYALPIFFKVTLGRQSFVPGPFSLGRWSIFCSWVAVIWVAAITILFSLPVAYPIKKDTLNYTPIAVGGVFILVLASWVFSARHWFRGPIRNIQT